MVEFLAVAMPWAFSAFMAVSTGFAVYFASTVKAGFQAHSNEIRTLYEKREADLKAANESRLADLERFLRELYDHRLDDTKLFGNTASSETVHALRNETQNMITAARTEMTGHVSTLRDDLRGALSDIKAEIAHRRRTNDNRDHV